MAPTPDDDIVVRPFADFLRDVGKGACHDELSEKLNDLVTAVEETGKAGSITLTLTVKPMEKGNVNALLVSDAITVKKPTTPRKASVFFPDGGNLVRNDPNQPELSGLRDVSDPGEREDDARERAAGGRDA